MKSINQIDKFIKETRVFDPDKYELLLRLRHIVHNMLSTVTETFKYGGILFSLIKDFGGLFVSKNHVSFEFTYGYQLKSNLTLEGKGKFRRHLN